MRKPRRNKPAQGLDLLEIAPGFYRVSGDQKEIARMIARFEEKHNGRERPPEIA